MNQMHLKAPSSPDSPKPKIYRNLIEGPESHLMPEMHHTPEEQRFTSEIVPMVTNDSESKEGLNESNSLELRKSPYINLHDSNKKMNNFQLKPVELGPEHIENSSDHSGTRGLLSSGKKSEALAQKD